jgi:carboxypeptidase C (cathepsin A)
MQKDMAPLYNYLIDGGYGLKILVYSGDDDSVCATSGTDAWIWDLGYETIAGKYWRDWKVDEQVAGYVSHFEDGVMTYATVHGAGHEVPTYKPKQALDLLQKFLSNEW